jgi:putative sigma-54 modulation protein
MYASIDQVVDKLERQIKKYKGKLIDRTQQPRSTKPVADLDNNSRPAGEPKIVKVKQFAVKPMTPEEAALQMELLGHDFYVFTNSETEEINVVYRRKDDNYGLIEPIYQ